jgi:hypothetical protein
MPEDEARAITDVAKTTSVVVQATGGAGVFV